MTGDPRRRLPLAVVILAIAAMAVAARSDGGLDGGVGTGVWGDGRVVAALAALALLGVVATNFAKHRDDGYGMLHRAGTATAVLLTAAAVLTPIGLLFLGRKPEPPPVQQPDPPVTASPRFPSMPSRSGVHTGSGKDGFARAVGLTLLFLVVAAAFALLVYVLVRLLSRRWFSRLPLELADFDPLGPELEQLAEAVAAGTEALEYEGDAREAVIACYSAMELAVSAGGGGRRATDTPEEFLRRVTAANLIPDEPARKLTELFREARFSRHRIAEEKRDAAREALRVISVHVQGRAAALAAEAAQQAQAQATAAAAAPTGGSR
ncbi:hypothetical protein ABH926_010037 [Catenulispora sp. GP43]|uniref:DUF4129 domain-containing protein n=1 Tax=Catenulispora sp. GP43 TaxID=3156263 RepID=UPI0035137687